jgi:hypothetical protein
VNLWFGGRLFEPKLQELSFEKDTEHCWKRLLWNYKPKDGVGLFKAFIDCAFEALHDYLDEVDWICRETWKTQGGSVSAEFVRKVVSPVVVASLEEQASTLKTKLKQVMRHKELKNRTPVLHHLAEATKQLKATMASRYASGKDGLERREINSQPKTQPQAANAQLDEKLVPRAAQVVEPVDENGLPGNPVGIERSLRREAVNAFIAEVLLKTGRKIIRKNIWMVAHYKERTEFERFQRGDRRTTKAAIEAFNRVLKMDPEDFIRLIDKKSAPR